MKPRQIRVLALVAGLFLVCAGLRAATCTVSDTVLCLSAQRFGVEVRWRDFQGNTGSGKAVNLTSDTGYFWFFSESNVELVVKVLDARGFNGHFWVFFGALSNVEYTLTVTDTATGSSKTYQNPSGQFASVGDTSAFRVPAAGGIATHETMVAEGTPTPTESLAAIQSLIEAAGSTSASEIATKEASFTQCPGPSTSLYLSNCRFELSVEWTDFQGRTGSGQAVQLTSDTGYFWFFSESNVELIVKALDARGFNDRFWIFYGALSNVEYSLHVTDRVSGALRIYRNSSGNFASVGDTSAFRGGYGVAVSLDSTRAVSGEIIAAAGGTLSATAADGTVFTLEIPPNAFLSDKTVTMTPVAAIQGFPFSGGLVAAVDLQPSGVYLGEGARLTIRTPSPIPQAEETSFAWNGSGEDFFLYPPVAAGGNLQLSISHFGGYGVARGTEPERQSQSEKEPVGENDQLNHQIAPFLREGRSEARSGSSATVLRSTDPAWKTRVISSLEQEWGRVRSRMLVASHPDEVVGVENELQTWLHVVAANGLLSRLLPPERNTELTTLVEGMLRRALIGIHTRCNANVSAIKDLPRIIALSKRWILNVQDEVDKALRCLNFRLRFDSTIVVLTRGEEGAQATFTFTVTAEFPLRYGPSNAIVGAGSISYKSFSASVGDCSVNLTPSTVTSIFAAELDLVPDLDLAKVNGPADAKLLYDPGHPHSEQAIVTCPNGRPVVLPLQWRDAYDLFHGLEANRQGFYELRSLQPTGGKTPWATKTHAQGRNFANSVLNETTVINIDHTPE